MNYDTGKEGCVRETQEGFPSPLKSVVFETFSKFQKLRQRVENTFSARCCQSYRHKPHPLSGGVANRLPFVQRSCVYCNRKIVF